MRLLNVKYKCEEGFEKEDFFNYVFDWVRSTLDDRYYMDIEESDPNTFLTYTYQRKKLYFVDYSEYGYLAAKHEDEDVYGTKWDLSITFNFKTKELFIQMNNSLTSNDGQFLRKFVKPDIINYLIDDKVIKHDEDVKILNDVHYIYEENTKEIEDVVLEKVKYTLPVIYASCTTYGPHVVDVEKMGKKYGGIAHVVAQYDEGVKQILIDKLGKKAVVDGSIAIYFPTKALDTNYFSYKYLGNKNINKAIQKAICFYYKDVNFGSLTTYNDIANFVIHKKNEDLIQENNEVYKENTKVKNENNSIVETFDLDIKKVEEENRKLKDKISNLENENLILKNRLDNIKDKPLLYYGKEEELYVGEIKELLIDMLEDINLIDNSRRKHIIQDILNNNQIDSKLNSRHEELKRILIDYKGLTNEKYQRLEMLGFTITSDGKHHKLVYKDQRYAIALPKTPSDTNGGKNAATDIIKKMM